MDYTKATSLSNQADNVGLSSGVNVANFLAQTEDVKGFNIEYMLSLDRVSHAASICKAAIHPTPITKREQLLSERRGPQN